MKCIYEPTYPYVDDMYKKKGLGAVIAIVLVIDVWFLNGNFGVTRYEVLLMEST